jgi:hypothetical protein
MPWRHIGEWRYDSHTFLALTLIGGLWTASCSSCFTWGKNPLDRGLDGPQSLSGCDGKGKSLCSVRNRTLVTALTELTQPSEQSNNHLELQCLPFVFAVQVDESHHQPFSYEILAYNKYKNKCSYRERPLPTHTTEDIFKLTAYACPHYNYWNRRSIFTKSDMDVDTGFHSCFFYFPTISKKKMADTKTCELGVTLAII